MNSYKYQEEWNNKGSKISRGYSYLKIVFHFDYKQKFHSLTVWLTL